MVTVTFEPHFKKSFSKIKDISLKEKVIAQVEKIKNNPEIGKPMKFSRKGTRELYIPLFRLSYRIEDNIVYILDLYHKNLQ